MTVTGRASDRPRCATRGRGIHCSAKRCRAASNISRVMPSLPSTQEMQVTIMSALVTAYQWASATQPRAGPRSACQEFASQGACWRSTHRCNPD